VHTVPSDREKLKLNTFLKLYISTLCFEKGEGTTSHINNPALMHTVMSDREKLHLQTLLLDTLHSDTEDLQLHKIQTL